jgi:hypothetical protein
MDGSCQQSLRKIGRNGLTVRPKSNQLILVDVHLEALISLLGTIPFIFLLSKGCK